MPLLPLPTVDRCCFCTRKLSVACIFITMWSMLVTSHGMAIAYSPTCETIYETASGPIAPFLNVFKWIVYIVDATVIASSFAFLVGIFLSMQLTADVFIGSGLASMICSFIFGFCYLVQLFTATCSFNPSDSMALIMYSICWGYFIIIVNSYRDSMTDT